MPLRALLHRRGGRLTTALHHAVVHGVGTGHAGLERKGPACTSPRRRPLAAGSPSRSPSERRYNSTRQTRPCSVSKSLASSSRSSDFLSLAGTVLVRPVIGHRAADPPGPVPGPEGGRAAAAGGAERLHARRCAEPATQGGRAVECRRGPPAARGGEDGPQRRPLVRGAGTRPAPGRGPRADVDRPRPSRGDPDRSARPPTHQGQGPGDGRAQEPCRASDDRAATFADRRARGAPGDPGARAGARCRGLAGERAGVRPGRRPSHRPGADWKAWEALLKRAELRDARLHDARHTAATLLYIQQGTSARVAMQVLGHSQISLTFGTYSHVVPELALEAAARMEKALWGPENGLP
jgi:hypothetical protein